MKRLALFILLAAVCRSASAQGLYEPEHALFFTKDYKTAYPVYKLKPAVDIPLTLVTAGITMYGFSQIYSKDASSLKSIQDLRKSDLNGLDRWAAGLHSQKAADASDLFFYSSIAAPLLLLADNAVRGDAAKIGFLYLETLSITGVFYTGVPSVVDRYRPLTYSTEVPMDQRRSGNNRNSFFAGHVALVGTTTFFAAKVFSDYHPDSKLRPYLWTAAALATSTTGYLRHRAGKHFPTDILTGAAIGTLSGILVPHSHKVRAGKNKSFTLLPFAGESNGLALFYNL